MLMETSQTLVFTPLEPTKMELLAYALAFFGLFILIKGIKPTTEWIFKLTDKDLAKAVVIIAISLTVCFYLIAIIDYLLSF